MPDTLDEQIISDADDALEVPEKMQLAYTIRNTHRTIGAKLSSHLTRRFGMAGLPPDYFTVSLRGSAGQSLGAWAVQGLKIVVSGDANGLCGQGAFRRHHRHTHADLQPAHLQRKHDHRQCRPLRCHERQVVRCRPGGRALLRAQLRRPRCG